MRDRDETLIVGLLVGLFLFVGLVGDMLLQELRRRPRVVGIVHGGRQQSDDVSEVETG